jgi:choline dehydrogenase-like flavoprotein
MSRFHGGVVRTVDHQTASQSTYDVVIVGSGVSGSLIADELSKSHMRVLVVEAGPGGDLTIAGYDEYLSRFYTSVSKGSNSPYAKNRNAPSPRGEDIHKLTYGVPDASAYIVQNGPTVLDGNYARVVGGTTMHWQGNVPRMLPEDFEVKTRFGRGRDWPISYEDLMPYYRKAEFELGASADVEEQAYSGIHFEDGYVFPMQKMPPTYLDTLIAQYVDGMEVHLDGEIHTLKVRGIPQARNGIPNPKYDNGKGYVPVGAVSSHRAETGERCQGNTNCTPICPVQAKYDARRTLAKAMKTGRVDLLTQTVASKVLIDPKTGEVSGIECKTYFDLNSPDFSRFTVRGRVYVLAANAIETPRLMLASGLTSHSGLMGRNLMNHVYLFAWALMPKVAGAMRGTQGTSGIEALRGGAFRARHAGFHTDIINNGWTYATGAPYSDLVELVDDGNKYGAALREALVDKISRQLLLAFVIDVLPDPNNRVSVDPRYTDQLENLRPVISYTVPDYSLDAAVYAREMSRRIFQRLGAEDHTTYHPLDYGYVNHGGEGITINGGNHFSGTHIMGTAPSNSVVDSRQRSWDHNNLFLVGSGSMPTIATSNPTLTLAALCYRTTETILKDFA